VRRMEPPAWTIGGMALPWAGKAPVLVTGLRVPVSVVDVGLTGLPNVVGIDTVRIVIPRLKGPTHLQESAACATT
jgi:hypothetical protein